MNENEYYDNLAREQYGDVNWDLLTERTVWSKDYMKNKDKVWTKDGVRTDKKFMKEDDEYVIF